MRIFFLLNLVVVLFAGKAVYADPVVGKNEFSLKGRIIGRDTGLVVFWHFDENNQQASDTARLDKGEFQFSGTVNRASEAFLWTNLKNRNFDDPSVIRFLLGPGKIDIRYRLDDALHPVIEGSKAQSEKEDWDRENRLLLAGKMRKRDSLYRIQREDTAHLSGAQINRLLTDINSINEQIKAVDIVYIEGHSNSYLSGYLLTRHTKKLPVDSIERLYSALTTDVKISTIGHQILAYVYPLTDDNEFRKANPLVDQQFDQRLRDLHSVHELDFRDTLGNIVRLSSFKGKYLVIDFWASWCKPCIQNVPALDQLINHYSADSIQFISISVDDNLVAWKRAIVQHQIAGVQLLDPAGFHGLAAMYCKVLWVPTYLVIDPNGQIIKYDAPQAVEPELKVLLDKLLSRK